MALYKITAVSKLSKYLFGTLPQGGRAFPCAGGRAGVGSGGWVAWGPWQYRHLRELTHQKQSSPSWSLWAVCFTTDWAQPQLFCLRGSFVVQLLKEDHGKLGWWEWGLVFESSILNWRTCNRLFDWLKGIVFCDFFCTHWHCSLSPFPFLHWLCPSWAPCPFWFHQGS